MKKRPRAARYRQSRQKSTQRQEKEQRKNKWLRRACLAVLAMFSASLVAVPLIATAHWMPTGFFSILGTN